MSENDPWRIRANLTQGWRALGGHLGVDGGRLAFRPHGLDRATGGHGFDVPLTDVVAVGVAPRDGGVFSGGLRRRLRVGLADGSERLLVVNRVEQRARELGDLVEGAGGRLRDP